MKFYSEITFEAQIMFNFLDDTTLLKDTMH